MEYKKNEIVNKYPLAENITEFEVYSPDIAIKALPGQFIVYKIGETGERIPLTIADTNKDIGTVTVVVQNVGLSTGKLTALNKGDTITDFAGPLGNPSVLSAGKKYAVIGGGLGCAIAYPQAKELKNLGSSVTLIVGFKNKDFVFWEEKMKLAADKLVVCTDNGTYGFAGFVTDALLNELKNGEQFDEVIAIGPMPMMRAVCEITKQYEIKTIVSMNTIMIDGTGMCGGCRLTVDGKVQFACVQGPDFDGHKVDFDEAIKRNRTYLKEEAEAREKNCRLLASADKQQ